MTQDSKRITLALSDDADELFCQFEQLVGVFVERLEYDERRRKWAQAVAVNSPGVLTHVTRSDAGAPVTHYGGGLRVTVDAVCVRVTVSVDVLEGVKRSAVAMEVNA